MRLIVATGPETVELNYMWLPTFLGVDTSLKQHIEEEVSPLLVGKDMSDETLDAAHEAVIDIIEKKYPGLEGLRDYLDAVKFVGR